MYTANYSHHARNVELQGFDWIPKNSCWVGFPINPLQLCSVLLDLSSYHWWRKSYSWYWQSRLPVFTNTNRLFVHPMNTSICSKKRGFRAWWIRLYWSIYLKKVIILLFFYLPNIWASHPPTTSGSVVVLQVSQGIPRSSLHARCPGAHGTRTCMKWYENDSRLWPLNLLIEI